MKDPTPTPALRRFAGRLRKARLAAGMTHRQLALEIEKLGQRDFFGRSVVVSYSYLSRIETAQRFPSVEIAFALADALGVNRLWLLTGRDGDIVYGA